MRSILLTSPSSFSCCAQANSHAAPPLALPRHRPHTQQQSRHLLRGRNPSPLREDASPCASTPARHGHGHAHALTPLFDLYDFICGGPLLPKIGLSPGDDVASSLDEWLETGLHLSRHLGFHQSLLSPDQKKRIYHYYIPVFLWCKDQLARHAARFREGQPAPPLVIGVSAPQGSGKTTLVYCLEYLFNSIGRKAVSVSIDDFYLTAKNQAKLASQFAGNVLLELRGNAGTHDLSLGSETLKALCDLTSKDKRVKVPRYNKSANNGYGDRADPSTWPEVEGPLEVLLFEGWMLGFQPLEDEAVKAVDKQLEAVNRHLASYETWDKFVNSWLILQIGNPNWVYKWRLQAEIAMRADGKPGMTDEQVADFVSRYIPAYQAYLPGLYSKFPKCSKSECILKFEVDENRNPIA